jgi:hypothetical protein
MGDCGWAPTWTAGRPPKQMLPSHRTIAIHVRVVMDAADSGSPGYERRQLSKEALPFPARQHVVHELPELGLSGCPLNLPLN